jgi:hypothetical protein
MGHSMAKFASTTQSNQELDGKVLTFVGDRSVRQEPLAVILPQKAWTWATHRVYSKAGEMATFHADKRNYGKYFMGREEAGINVPFVLFIPLIAVKILDLHNKSKMLEVNRRYPKYSRLTLLLIPLSPCVIRD